MLSWTWFGWPDPVVDFGRELYVPWRLARGEVLYRDIVSYFNGPLSPYLHAMLFRVFGVSLNTLVGFNLLVLVTLTMMLYRLLLRIAGAWSALCGTLTFVLLFAFAQFVGVGNYNYVTPYSYELPYGITLAVAGILCLDRWLCTRRRLWLAAVGGLLGLVFLTKAEVFCAAFLALLCGVLAGLWTMRSGAAQTLKQVGVFAVCALAPVFCAFALLCIHLPPGEALGGLAGSWKWIGDRQLTSLRYFKDLNGTLDLRNSLIALAIWSIVYLVLALVPAALDLLLLRRRSRKTVAVTSSLLFVVMLAALGPYWKQINWTNFFRPAPLVMLAAAIVLMGQVWRRRRDAGAAPEPPPHRVVLRLVAVVFAAAMLLKIYLNAKIVHYGFALGMPAMLMMIAMLLDWVPELLRRAGGSGWPVRATALGALSVLVFAHLRLNAALYSIKTEVVGRDGDLFYSDRRGAVVDAVVEELRSTSSPDQTLVVVPEGLIINYLARRTNPTGQLNFTPPAILMYGEENMLAAFKAHPPDLVLVTDVDTSDYGPRLFGADYGRLIGNWIKENYTAVKRFGGPTYQQGGIGIFLLTRKQP